jgi:hypothetical protein
MSTKVSATYKVGLSLNGSSFTLKYRETISSSVVYMCSGIVNVSGAGGNAIEISDDISYLRFMLLRNTNTSDEVYWRLDGVMTGFTAYLAPGGLIFMPIPGTTTGVTLAHLTGGPSDVEYLVWGT